MSDRYRYSRARSPPLLNPGRISLPSNFTNYPQVHEHHHVVPSSRREVIPAPRSSTSSVSNGGTITTTYKVKSEAPTRGSSVREGSRTRRSTIDNHNRPTIVTTTQKYRPVIHSGGVARPESPLKNPYRSSEEEYVAIPAISRHGHHHTKRYSATMDNADMNRLARERETTRLQVVPIREPTYPSTRVRPVYTGVVTRHADTVSDDYGEDGYGYTNPRDLVQYDLTHNQPVHHRSRRDSFDAGRSGRPTSITGYADIFPRSYDARERGPPPTTRGFDKIRTPVYDQAPPVRPVRPSSPPSSLAPMEPVQRPAPFEPVEPVRRTSTSRARPTSMYQENREPRRAPREEYYETRDDDRRESRTHRHENPVEQRGFGVRAERPDRSERPERSDWNERSDRVDRVDRSERVERVDRVDRSDRNNRPDRSDRHDRLDNDRTDYKEPKEHKGRDAIATGLSLAGAALGVNALKNAARGDRDDREDREEREERKKREYEEDARRRREKQDRSPVDLGGRDPKERRHKDEDLTPPPRDMPPPPRDGPPREVTPPQAAFVDRNSRDAKDRKPSRDERERDPDRRERHRNASEAALNGTAIDSRSDSSASEEVRPRSRREPLPRRESGTVPAAFDPKNTMDLFALKEALNSKDSKDASTLAPKEPASKPRTPRGSSTRDPREAAEIRKGLNSERKSRDPLAPTENRQLRVVSPPREKVEEKPVKGILRQPREKFPEDPAPIREGVAPLKDAKKDGIPPDARWTKISRKLVNPEALEAGKERFEAREDFVIVLRVLSRDEVQGYAEVTQRIRSAREELEDIEATERRRARRERHERHKRERNGEIPRSERGERRHRRRGEEGRERHRESNSESDSTEDDDVYERPKMLEAPQKRTNFQDALMSGGLGEMAQSQSNLRETEVLGTYSGYSRNPPPPSSMAAVSAGSSRKEK
ncbi:hypothetical protein ONS95_009897 [Cadophora gregata]|uniref:uncharacterized protein n=1 Tax=Cadophora gregata TaxID=51156 RepID=UPI0026DD33F8|nr:uncharacterized protein ONS95_009897 [Cadophora gregata]KAK0121609.1 hypothetical protein ONS95_009897 [Cadophora gregata]